MPEYLAPAVYVEEVDAGPKPIAGVSTSTSGMVGFTQRGDVGRPTFLSSFAQFTALFGGYVDHRPAGYNARTQAHSLDVTHLPYAVEGFFANGGQRLYLVRVASDSATTAGASLFGVPATAADATLAGAADEGATSLTFDHPVAIDASSWLLIHDGDRSEQVQPDTGAATTGPVTLDPPLAFGHAANRAVARVDVAEGAAVALDATRTMAAGDTELAVDDATEATLHAGDVLRLRSTEDPGQQQLVVVDADGSRAIRGTFAFAFPPATSELHAVTTTAHAGDPARKISTAASAGDTDLTLNSYDALEIGDVVSVQGDNASQTEFRTVSTIRFTLPVNVPLLGGLRFPHPAGAAVAERTPLARIVARSVGAWGNAVRVTVTPASALATAFADDAADGAPFITLTSTLGVAPGTHLDVDRAAGGTTTHHVVTRVQGQDVYLDGGLTGGAAAEGDTATTREFALLVERVGADGRVVESESFTGLSLAPTHPSYAGTIIGRAGTTGGTSALVALSDDDAFDATTGQPLPSANGRPLPEAVQSGTRNGRPLWLPTWLAGGDDAVDTLDEEAYYGTDSVDPDDRTGLQALKTIDEVSLVAIPGITSQEVQERVIDHCEQMRYRFAVLDAQAGAKLDDVQAQRSLYDSTRAALYYPWAQILDPFDPAGRALLSIPPSGHVVGVLARTDVDRGVHKAPANEILRGVAGLEIAVGKPEQDVLNPRNINAIRSFRDINRGLRVWGARTLSSDPSWRYINVRRLFLFVEKSIERGTQWVVFEPNDTPLWRRVERSVSNFLTSVWRDGALQGDTADQAFFVQIGHETMTQDDIDNGRLIALIGIAPVRPAEFVIFRISQFTAEAQS